jgi:hypothetical protein
MLSEDRAPVASHCRRVPQRRCDATRLMGGRQAIIHSIHRGLCTPAAGGGSEPTKRASGAALVSYGAIDERVLELYTSAPFVRTDAVRPWEALCGALNGIGPVFMARRGPKCIDEN